MQQLRFSVLPVLPVLVGLFAFQPIGCAPAEEDETVDGDVSSGGTDNAGTGGAASGGAETGGAASGGRQDLGVPSGGSSDPGDASYDLVRYVVDVGCGVSICHGGCLDFVLVDTSTLYDHLLTTTIEECDGNPLITPGQPEASAFYRLITEGCGELVRMPNGCIDDCVPDEFADRISQWITDGALP